MIADATTPDIRIERMDRASAAKWAKLVTDALLAGRVSMRFGDEAIAALQVDGFYELASGVRCAQYTRTQMLAARAIRVWR